MATDRLSTPSGAATTPSSERDWTDQVTDLIVDKIDLLRDRTTGSIVTVARGAVYGLVALFVVAVVLIVSLAFLVPSDVSLSLNRFLPNGQLAVDMVGLNDYDLVLMDVRMPVMDGVLIVFLAFLGRLIDVVPGALWLKYAVLGALFVLAGGLVWSKRGTP